MKILFQANILAFRPSKSYNKIYQGKRLILDEFSSLVSKTFATLWWSCTAREIPSRLGMSSTQGAHEHNGCATNWWVMLPQLPPFHLGEHARITFVVSEECEWRINRNCGKSFLKQINAIADTIFASRNIFSRNRRQLCNKRYPEWTLHPSHINCTFVFVYTFAYAIRAASSIRRVSDVSESTSKTAS